MSQKGFTPLIIALIVVLIVGITIGTYYLGTQKIHKSNSLSQITNPSPTPFTQSTPSLTQPNNVMKLSDAWNLGTKTYSNPKIDIIFNYPSYFDVKEVDIQKENADWQAQYKNNPNVKQPLYTSTFYATFSTPNQESVSSQEMCDNKMNISVQKYDNPQSFSLYDFIADSHKTYPGNGITETFDTYKKDLKTTTLPKAGSYVFEGIVGENPVKTVYFTNKGKVYTFGLIGNCNTGGQYTPDADKVFESILKSIKYL